MGAIGGAWLELLKVIEGRYQDTIDEAFDQDFISEKGRYHQFDSLHPRPPEESDGNGNGSDDDSDDGKG